MIKIDEDQNNFMDSYGRLIVDNKFQYNPNGIKNISQFNVTNSPNQ